MKSRLSDSTGQAPIGQAPAALVIAGYSMTLQIDANYYEAGRAAQNVFLEGVSLGIGTIGIRGFDSNKVNRDINLPTEESALYIMPLGKK